MLERCASKYTTHVSGGSGGTPLRPPTSGRSASALMWFTADCALDAGHDGPHRDRAPTPDHPVTLSLEWTDEQADRPLGDAYSTINLLTSDRRPVVRAAIPSAFNAAPDVVIWGERVFRQDDGADYLEAFTWAVPAATVVWPPELRGR